MRTGSISSPLPGMAGRWRPVALTLAFRELRAGVGGFAVFVSCIALGVMVIAAVGALADAIGSSLKRQGATLIGGDVTLSRPHRRVEADELRQISSLGRVSEAVTLRAMARRLDGGDQLLVEAKGVDGGYPMLGTLQLTDQPGGTTGIDPQAALRSPGRGTAVAPILLERLGLKIGDRFRLGRIEVEVRAVIQSEPDKISDRLAFGPRVLVSIDTLIESGLADPGGLAKWRYAVLLSGDQSGGDPGLVAARDGLRRTLPEAGFTVIDRRDPNPQVTRSLERMRQFLTLVGLTSLLIGGVGVANAVSTYIDRRRKVIATLKSLGASRGIVFWIHLIQVMAMAAIGIVLGLIAGLSVPWILGWLLGGALPIELSPSVSAGSLLLAGAYGVLVALLFTLWPLGRAGLIRPSALFRDEVGEARAYPGWPAALATALVGALLLMLALATSDSRWIALSFCLGAAGILLAFWLLGVGLTWLARRIPHPRIPEFALALGSIGAPGGLTRAVTVSLGSGLSLLVAVALVDASIVGELSSRLPKNSPSFFILDLPKGEVGAFRDLVRRQAPEALINEAPMLRGRIVRIGGIPVEQVKTAPEAQWVLSGDRGLSYADEVPEGSRVIEGNWWPKGYAGEPLVSFEAELAKALALGIGDTVTVNVLGRDVTARISNLREVRWESLAINFVMVFSPNTLAGAPHNMLATIALPPATPLAVEAELSRRIGQLLPATTAIRVRDAINAFNGVFERVIMAVRAAAGVTLLAGALVLAGALAAARRRRLQTAVLMKAIGATRWRIIGSHLAEYLLLSLTTATLAVLVGTLAASVVTAKVMDLPLVFSVRAIVESLGVAMLLVLALGGIGTWRILATRPVPHLRGE